MVMESSMGYGFLSDIDIKRYLKDGSIKIETLWHDELAFNPEKQVQLGSVDLRFRHECKRMKKIANANLTYASLKNHDYTESFEAENGKLLIKPGEIILTTTLETVTFSNDFAGIITGRSSIARLGIMVHCCQEFINPGHGQTIPLQLINLGSNTVELDLNTPICQLIIVKLMTAASDKYHTKKGAKYAKEVSVENSKIYEEVIDESSNTKKETSVILKRNKNLKKKIIKWVAPILQSILATIICSNVLVNKSQSTTVGSIIAFVGRMPVSVLLIIAVVWGYVWLFKESDK